jgi:hypothetical protein
MRARSCFMPGDMAKKGGNVTDSTCGTGLVDLSSAPRSGVRELDGPVASGSRSIAERSIASVYAPYQRDRDGERQNHESRCQAGCLVSESSVIRVHIRRKAVQQRLFEYTVIGVAGSEQA